MDYQAQLEQAKQRAKRYGEQAQYQSPQAQMVGGRYVAPHALQYLAAALRAGGGMVGEQMANKEATQFEAQRKQAVADALRKFGQQAQGTPENAPGDGMGPVIPAQPPNMMGAYQGLLDAPDAKLRDMALQGMAKIPEAQAMRDARTDEMRQRGEQRIQELQIAHQNRMDQMAASNANIEQMKQAQMDFQREMVKLRASMSNSGGGGAQPYFQPVQTAQGVMSFNARTGRMEPITGADGRPFIGAAADPSLQGQIAGAKKSATDQAESVTAARGDARKADMFLQQLTQAENILNEGPTQSGVGAAIDAVGRVVGASSKGAQRAGQLEALSGWLVANVPRMEGPQSNFDVQNYITMAGRIGDRTVPVKERQAAAAEIKRLQSKYKESAEGRMGGAQQPPSMPTKKPPSGGGLSAQEQAELAALRQRFNGGR